MEAEVQGLVLGFDYALIIRQLLFEQLGRKLCLDAFVENKNLFNFVSKDSSKTERRLKIGIFALRDIYAKEELSCIGWIPIHENSADPLTKPVMTNTYPLWNLMTTNVMKVSQLGWADVHL